MKQLTTLLGLSVISFITTGCSGDSGSDGNLSTVSTWTVEGRTFPVVTILAKPESDPNPFIEVQVDGIAIYFVDKWVGCNDSMSSSNYVTVFFPEINYQEFSAPITVRYDAFQSGGEGGGVERESGFPGELILKEVEGETKIKGWVELEKLLEGEGRDLTLTGTFKAKFCSE